MAKGVDEFRVDFLRAVQVLIRQARKFSQPQLAQVISKHIRSVLSQVLILYSENAAYLLMMCCETTTDKVVFIHLLTSEKFSTFKKRYSLYDKSINEKSYCLKTNFTYQPIIKPFFNAILRYFHSHLA